MNAIFYTRTQTRRGQIKWRPRRLRWRMAAPVAHICKVSTRWRWDRSQQHQFEKERKKLESNKEKGEEISISLEIYRQGLWTMKIRIPATAARDEDFPFSFFSRVPQWGPLEPLNTELFFRAGTPRFGPKMYPPSHQLNTHHQVQFSPPFCLNVQERFSQSQRCRQHEKKQS